MPSRTPWILTFHTAAAPRARLFCFPHAGGGASAFREWAGLVPAGVEVCAVQPPGRENRLREPPLTALPPLVVEAAAALLPWLDLPFAFFGHSLGALAAFEVARQLRRQGAPTPTWLFAAGCEAPQRLRPADPPLHALPRERFLAELRRLEGTPEAVLNSAELLDVLLPLLRADFAVLETYRYRPELPLACPITAVGGVEDRQISRDDLAAWGEQTAAGVEMHLLPGGHFFPRTACAGLLELLNVPLRSLVNKPAEGGGA
jgi:medium-chain acyl-[acyl-carrier-protein] hydrolase